MKFPFKLFITAYLLLFSILPLYSENPRENIDILDSLAKSAAMEFCKKTAAMETDSLKPKLTQHPAAWLIEKNIVSCAVSEGIKILSGEDSTPAADIWIGSVGVSYEKIPDSDLVKRTCRVRFSSSITIDGKGKTEAGDFERSYSDTLNRYDIGRVQHQTYTFAKAELPPEDPSFWESIAEPAIIITSAAVAVALFFTVRSE